MVPVACLSVSHKILIAMKITILYYNTKQKQNYDINKKNREKVIQIISRKMIEMCNTS